MMRTYRIAALAALALFGLQADFASSQPSGSSRDEQSLRAYLQQEHRADRADAADTRYSVGWADLNGDGRAEALVQLVGPFWCGTGGCGLDIYTPERNGWRRVADISVTQAPIRVLDTRSHGWRDIGVFVQGGGIIHGYEARLSFNGRSYPDNPTVPPARRVARGTRGHTLIPDNAPGRPLWP